MPTFSAQTPQEIIDEAMAAVKAAVPKAEKDTTRPVYHFRPPAQWMNDVCGIFHYGGYYHVFFAFNPRADRFGEGKGWGHARSSDLVQWEFLPPALLPSKATGDVMDNSGSAMIRDDGTPVLFFGVTPVGYPKKKREQWAAVPVDEDLLTWRRIDVGLAAGKSGVPAEIKPIWTDMFAFRAGGRTFATFKESDGLICEAQNSQLTAWKAVGRIDGVDGECPNLFPLDGHYVLIRSTYPISYMVGEFDPETIDFRVTGGGPHVMDHAYGGSEMPHLFSRGLYGTTVFTDPRGRTILLGWISGFKAGRGWNGCMSLPRILSLDENQALIQTPASELEHLRKEHVHVENLRVDSESKAVEGAKSETLEIMAELVPGTARAFGMRVRCSENGQHAVTLRYANGVLNVAGTEVPVTLGKERKALKLHMFLDKSVMEVFIDDGQKAVTRVIYPREKDMNVQVFAEDGAATVLFFDVWKMKPIW